MTDLVRDAEALALLATESRHPVAPHVVGRLTDLVSHDPACLTQTAAALRPEHLAGTAMLPDPLPVVPAVRAAVEPLGLDHDARRLLLVAAVAVVDRTDVLLAASRTSVEALLAGPAARHLTLGAGRFAFRDARTRSVVHGDADLAARTAAHAALAQAHRDAADHTLALWHTALSTIAGDALLADGLVETAEQHLARGDVRRALEVAREAASHGAGSVRSRAFALTGRAALWAGHVHDAVAYLRRSAESGGSPGVVGQVGSGPLAAALAVLDAPAPSAGGQQLATLATPLLAVAESEADSVALDAARRALLLAHDAPRESAALLARAEAALSPARRSGCWFDGPGTAMTPLAEAHLRVAQAMLALRSGDVGHAAGLLAEAAGRLPVALAFGGLAVALARRLDLVRRGEVGVLARALEASVRGSVAPGVRAAVLGDRALAADCAGRHAQAATLLTLAAERGGEDLRGLWLPLPDPVELFVLAGRRHTAVQALARLRASVPRAGDPGNEGPARPAGAWPDGAWPDGAWPDGAWPDGAWPDGGAASPGFRGALRRTLDVARGEVVLADAGTLPRACERAVTVSLVVGSTLERGLTELVIGRAWARHGSADDAVAHLLAAQELFHESGAYAWARLAERVLAQPVARRVPGPATGSATGSATASSAGSSAGSASAPLLVSAPGSASAQGPAAAGPVDGTVPGDPGGDWSGLLTERELDVARLVVQGRSNRDVAEVLYVSVRTVEVHLGRVFRKLGVRSRTELVVLAHRS